MLFVLLLILQNVPHQKVVGLNGAVDLVLHDLHSIAYAAYFPVEGSLGPALLRGQLCAHLPQNVFPSGLPKRTQLPSQLFNPLLCLGHPLTLLRLQPDPLLSHISFELLHGQVVFLPVLLVPGGVLVDGTDCGLVFILESYFEVVDFAGVLLEGVVVGGEHGVESGCELVELDGVDADLEESSAFAYFHLKNIT